MLFTDSESGAMLSIHTQQMNQSDSIQTDDTAETFSKLSEKSLGLLSFIIF